MVEIRVCTEGACSNKGAYAVYRALASALAKQKMEDQVELSPCGCLKDCNKAGVCVAVGERCFSVMPQTAADFVRNEIAPLLANK